MRKIAFITLAVVLATAAIPIRAQTLDADVQKGIAQVDDGDYDGAILTLDNAARRLAPDKTRTNDLAQAYLYLGIAYIGKGREAAAKAKFREAISQIKDLSLAAEKFPPKVIDLFEAAKADAAREAEPGPSPTTPAGTTKPPAAAQKKGGSGKTFLIVGGIAAGGGAAALAGGGGSKATVSATPSDTRSRLTFSGTLPDSQGSYRCYTVVATKAGTLEATLAWTNGQIAFGIGCGEAREADCPGTYNRTSNTSATYTATVTQRTYQICPYNNEGAADSFNLVVLFP